MTSLAKLCLAFAAAYAAFAFEIQQGEAAPSWQTRQQPPTQFLDRPRFREEHITDEEEANRREAMTLFAIGRMKSNEEQHAEAIRMFQRAHRLDRASLPILRQIVPEAFELDRPGEAIRYAQLAVELDPEPNPLLLEFLAQYFARNGDSDKALDAYGLIVSRASADERATADFVRTQLVLGQLHFARKEFAQAVESYKVVQAARLQPAEFAMTSEDVKSLLDDEVQTLTLMAESFLEAGDVDQAESLFADAAEIAKQEADKATLATIAATARLRHARILAARDQPDAALDELNAFLADENATVNPIAIDLLDKLYQDTNRDDLINRLKEIAAANPDNVGLVFRLAQSLEAEQRLDQAVTVLTELQGREQVGAGIKRQVLRELIRLNGEQRNAQQLFASVAALAESTDSPAVFERLSDGSWKSDAELLQQILAVADSLAESQTLTYGESLAAAVTALNAAEYDRAEPFFNQAIQQRRGNKADLLLLWGINLLMDEQYSQAAEVYGRGIRERALPFGQPEFYYHQASALAMLEDYPQAVNAARRAAAMAADSPRILARLAWVQYQAGNVDEAVSGYELIVRRFDEERSSTEIREVVRQARMVLSALSVDRGEMAAGEEWLEQVLDEFPDDIGAMNDLGYLWADQDKNLNRAHEMISRAVEAEPENAAYLDSLGWVLHRLGRHEESIARLKQSVELREQADGVALDHLGDAYFAAKNIAAAKEAWQDAIQAFDPVREADKIQEVAAKLSRHAQGN